MKQIINSLLDTDLYKLTMGQAVFHQHPDLNVTYRFKCRNKDVKFTEEMVEEIKEQARLFSRLHFRDEEIQYVGALRYMKYSYIEFLKLYHPIYEHFNITLNKDGTIAVTIKGPWYQTIFWEVPLLSIINEVYFYYRYTDSERDEITKQCEIMLDKKINDLNNNVYVLGTITDFGTRRRYSFDWMDHVIDRFSSSDLGETKFIGTSNVYFAMKYNLLPVGTNAHEWYMAAQGMKNVPLAHTNAYMLGSWVDEYHGDLGIALDDCYNTDIFMRDFDLFHSKLWDGVRNDSGDPIEWGDKWIKHFESMRIDPKTKTLLFSNSLDFELAHKIYTYFKDRAKTSFGIGTFITGVQKFIASFGPVEPLNIVIKLSEVNGMPVAKLSNDITKATCDDPTFLNHLIQVLSLNR